MRVVLSFAVLVVAELATFMAVEARIGFANALLVTLAAAFVGLWLVRRAGSGVMGQLRRRLSEGGLPARELTHGASLLIAGLLLLIPGFLTDALGFLLLVPGVRNAVHRQVAARMHGRVTVIGSPGGGRPGVIEGEPRRTEIVDAESWEEL